MKIIFIYKNNVMGCSCKANTSVKRQATRVVRRVSNTSYSSSINSTPKEKTKKTVVVRRVAR